MRETTYRVSGRDRSPQIKGGGGKEGKRRSENTAPGRNNLRKIIGRTVNEKYVRRGRYNYPAPDRLRRNLAGGGKGVSLTLRKEAQPVGGGGKSSAT